MWYGLITSRIFLTVKIPIFRDGGVGGGRGDILAAARLKANFFLYDAIFAVNFCRQGFSIF